MSRRNWGWRNKEEGNPLPGHHSAGVSSHLIQPCRPGCPRSSCIRKERPFTLSCEQMMGLVWLHERQGQARWLWALETWLSVAHHQAAGPFPPTSTQHPVLRSSGLWDLPSKSGQEEHHRWALPRITHLDISLRKGGVLHRCEPYPESSLGDNTMGRFFQKHMPQIRFEFSWPDSGFPWRCASSSIPFMS